LENSSLEQTAQFKVGSKDWADRKLKFFAGFLNDHSTWNLPHNRYNKVIVAREAIFWLERYGFVWHAERLRNHLNRWKKCMAQQSHDTPRERGGAH
jgi:hypothetical protein